MIPFKYDYETEFTTEENLTEDNDVFKSIAKIYSFNHLHMMNQSSYCNVDEELFTDGITNGGLCITLNYLSFFLFNVSFCLAKWYPLKGGMQDFNYWGIGCLEVTIELTCCKYPSASELSQVWLDNKKSLIEYLKVANTGIRGVITYSNGM